MNISALQPRSVSSMRTWRRPGRDYICCIDLYPPMAITGHKKNIKESFLARSYSRHALSNLGGILGRDLYPFFFFGNGSTVWSAMETAGIG